MQETARRLAGWSTGLQACGKDPVRDTSTVAMGVTNAGEAKCKNLQNCGLLWLCTICAEKIARGRQEEMNRLLAWARARPADDQNRRLFPVMPTYTARHGIDASLVDQLGAMKTAKKRLRQSRPWKALKRNLLGSVTATEITHGGNGWHPHFHEILLVWAKDEAEAMELVEGVRAEWMRSLDKMGLDGNDAAFQVQGAAAAGNYIAKWGAAEELALSGKKKSKGGRTPDQLLEDATNGDAAAARLWVEYALATRGRHQLVWSPGLKKLAGIDDVADEELAAAEEETADEHTFNVVEHVPVAIWRRVARRKPALLDAMEEGFERGGLVGARAALWEAINRILAPPGGVGAIG